MLAISLENFIHVRITPGSYVCLFTLVTVKANHGIGKQYANSFHWDTVPMETLVV